METTVIFNRKGVLDQEGKGVIEIQIYVSRGKRPCRTTSIRIEPKHWDAKKRCVKKSHTEAEFLNAQILALKTKIENFILSEKIRNGKVNLDDFDRKQHLFYEFFEKEVMGISNADLSRRTQYTYARALKYLKEYSLDIPIDAFTVSFLEGFNKFLIEQKNLAVNSRAALFSKIKKVVSVAVSNDLMDYSKNPFRRGFGVHEVEVPPESLTLDELRSIEDLNMSFRPELEKTRDMFLFACYTGIRFGDLSELTLDNFDFLPTGKIRLKYLQNKTLRTNRKRIEWIITDFWNGKADAIILKYRELHKDTRDHQFFNYTNQFYNRNLKELQRFAKIETLITSHLARHTCISLLINDYGLSIDNAQMIAGHAKIETTMRYLKKTEIDLSNAAGRLNWG